MSTSAETPPPARRAPRRRRPALGPLDEEARAARAPHPPTPPSSPITCDLCGEEARTFNLDPRAPDVLCCASCATLTPAQVARRYLAAAWPRCPRTGAACRSGTCAGCV